jgi:tetratricopeptide (TPR) repeat protein
MRMRNKKLSVAAYRWMVVLSLFGLVSSGLAQGLPGEVLITQRWRELSSNYSALSNPAFLTQENYLTGHFAMSSILQEFTLMQAGATIPLGLYQSVGLTWTTPGSNQIELWDNGTRSGDSVASAQFNYFTGSYAINPWNGLSVGGNLNLIQQNAFADKGLFAGGVDLGISYRLIKHQFIGTHLFGANLQNLLTLKLFGTGVFDPFARNLRFSLYSTYVEKLVETNFDYCIKDLFPSGSAFVVGSPKALETEFSGRVGVAIIQMFRLYGMFGLSLSDTTGNTLRHWGAGLTLNGPAVYQGRDVLFGYQILNVSQVSDWFHTFYLRGEFGPHREEAFAKNDKLDVAPNAIYLKALQLYKEGKYWEAYFLFSQILNEYPDFFNNDWVLFYTGSCQEKMDMREISLFTHHALELEYPFSNAMIPSRLSTMRIYYRNGDFSNVEKLYQQLQEATVADSIKFSADYIMGQTLLEQKNYEAAIEMLSRIHPSHCDYLFAQHSIAVAQFGQEKFSEAMLSLQNCITETPKDKERKEVVARSYLLLGFLLYENPLKEDKPLSKAVAMLREIPPQSIYYDEATLALGWTAIKAQQFADCIKSGEVLMASKNPLFHFEGALITAYGYMSQQKFLEAKDILTTATSQIENLRPISEDSVSLEQQRYLDTRASYEFLAKRVAECAQKQQIGPVVQENTDLHNEQREVKKKIDGSISYFDAYKKGLFLTRNYETIKSETAYMFAVVSRRTGATGQVKEMEKAKEKEKDIDKEIKALEEKMKQMEKNGK